MRKINLLPPDMLQKNKAQNIKIGLFMLQIFMVLLVVLVVVLVSNAEKRTENRLIEMSSRVLEIDDRPLLLVHEIEELRRAEAHFPQGFCASWLVAVLETQPYGGTLSHLNFRQGEIFFAGEVENINEVEQHRLGLLAAGFGHANLGRWTLASNGRFEYEMRITRALISYEEW